MTELNMTLLLYWFIPINLSIFYNLFLTCTTPTPIPIPSRIVALSVARFCNLVKQPYKQKTYFSIHIYEYIKKGKPCQYWRKLDKITYRSVNIVSAGVSQTAVGISANVCLAAGLGYRICYAWSSGNISIPCWRSPFGVIMDSTTRQLEYQLHNIQINHATPNRYCWYQ